MKADISRATFDPGKHYLRVLMQQGRVQLDADFNEQAAILLHHLQTLATDLIGPFGGPAAGAGFEIKADPQVRRYHVSQGRYYVDGLLLESGADLDSGAEGSRLPALPDGRRSLLYLDVWEREVHPIEDGTIREVALGGLDTALRSKIVWRVRAVDKRADGSNIPETRNGDDKEWLKLWQDWLKQWQPENRGRLRAEAKADAASTDLCLASPEARYRGTENQLYRVEIHRGGKVGGAVAPTFKWSRDNASVVFPVVRSEGDTVTLEHLGRDTRSGLEPGDWVEVMDDDISGKEAADPLTLFQVDAVDPRRMTVRLKTPKPDVDVPEHDEESALARHALLRRWDHREIKASQGGKPLQNGALPISEGAGDNGWLPLEDGIRIQFQPGGTYRLGDYWLIPARTATEDVEWSGAEGNPDPLPPHGIGHHFAPLAIVTVDGTGKLKIETDKRRLFSPIP